MTTSVPTRRSSDLAIVEGPLRYLIPMVFVMAAFGAFGLTGNLSGPATVLVFAILGWAMRRYDYSIPAAVIGLLLGSMAEGELLRSIQIRGGRFEYPLRPEERRGGKEGVSTCRYRWSP